MKKLLVLSLFLIVSCSKEPELTMLDRCVDANTYKNEWISKKIVFFDWENQQHRDGNAPATSDSISEFTERLKTFLVSLNELEEEIEECVSDKEYYLWNTPDYYEKYSRKMTPELEELHNQCELEVGDKYFTNVDYAVEICNSQGIY
jgi:hypothetical protein